MRVSRVVAYVSPNSSTRVVLLVPGCLLQGLLRRRAVRLPFHRSFPRSTCLRRNFALGSPSSRFRPNLIGISSTFRSFRPNHPFGSFAYFLRGSVGTLGSTSMGRIDPGFDSDETGCGAPPIRTGVGLGRLSPVHMSRTEGNRGEGEGFWAFTGNI